jgi:hypothetical protein
MIHMPFTGGPQLTTEPATAIRRQAMGSVAMERGCGRGKRCLQIAGQHLPISTGGTP